MKRIKRVRLSWIVALIVCMMLSSQLMYAEEYREDITSNIEDEVSGVAVEAFKTGDDYPWDLKSVAIDSKVDPWNFYNRECTSFVAWCLNDRNEIDFHNYYGGVRWGNAKNWGTAARSIGITVNKTPSVGSVAWWESGQYGHVAWVNAINGDAVTIEEYNGSYPGAYSSREIFVGAPSGYIHIKDISFDSPEVHAVEIVDRGYCGGEGDGTNISWTLDTEGVLRIEGSGRMKDWDITEVYPRHNALSDWHKYYEDIEVVDVSPGINRFGSRAFENCPSLSSISLPDSLASIGDSTFESCDSLINISLPDSLTSIGDCTFSDCGSLSNISLPDSLASIGDYTFAHCDSLSSISLPDSLASIGDYTFAYCDSLKSISLPDSLTSIGSNTFAYCDSLSSISLPDSLTSIGYSTFYDCDSLSSISLPDSLTSIGFYTFACCDSLSSISLPDSLTSIGGYTFAFCDSLRSIRLPDSLTSIGDYTFCECDSLSSISIPLSVTFICKSAFLDTGLKDIYYAGNASQWKKIEVFQDEIKNGYDGLFNATIHYNSTNPDHPGSDHPAPAPYKSSLDDQLVNATAYNKELAVIAADLASKTYVNSGKNDEGVREFLTGDHKFSNEKIYSNNYGAKFIFNWGSLAFTLATRKYNGPGDDGNTDILVIVAQGSTNPYELYNDAYSEPDYEKMQDFGGHAPYGIVEDFYNAIVEGLPNVVESGKKYKVLVTGHSLGGAAANLVAANLSDGRVKGVRTSREDVFCYTFGAINSIWPNSLVQNNYENIHNVYNLYDTFSPLQYGYIMDNGAGGGFGKFGRMHLFLMDYRTQEQYNQGWLEPDGGYNFRQLIDCVNHDMDKYLNYVERVREGTTGFITREALDAVPSLEESLPYLSLIFCPVDVDIYRGNELVGRVTNNVVDTAVTTIDIRVEGDAKIIIYPDDQKYELRISAFDEGRMTYGQIDLRESSGIKVIKDIVLTQEKTFSSTVGGNVDVEDVKLFVTDTSGEKIYEVLDDGTEVEVEAEPDTNDKLEDFVVRLYRNFLKREPDENGLSDWVDALRSGKGTGAKVVSGFVLSPEYKANSLSNEEYVAALYRIIFNREPDAAGLNSWVSVMENGCTNKKVLAGFVNSTEFGNLCSSLRIQQGSYTSDEIADKNSKISAFVARLYKVCLGRQYEQEGLNNWVSGLLNKSLTGSSVAEGFFKSQEFTNRNLSDRDFVTVAYRTLLNREPDTEGLNSWLSALGHKSSRMDVVRGFLKSEEFGQLCSDFGIMR